MLAFYYYFCAEYTFKMNSSLLLTLSMIIGIILTVTALRNDDCEGK